MADYRDDVHGEPQEVAAIAHELYESDGLEDNIADYLDELIETFVGEDLSDADRRLFAEKMARDSKGALFMLRNGLVSCDEANLERGDVIEMVAANDPDKTIRFRVRNAFEDRPGLSVVRVAEIVDGEVEELDGDDRRVSDLDPGQIIHDDRFTVQRQDREEPEEVTA